MSAPSVRREAQNDGMIASDIAKLMANDATSPPIGGSGGMSDDLLSTVEDLDRRLSRLTGQRIGLRMGVPLIFGAIGLWRTAFFGLGIAEIPGFVWLWYTFDSFYKLNVQSQASDGRPVSSESGA